MKQCGHLNRIANAVGNDETCAWHEQFTRTLHTARTAKVRKATEATQCDPHSFFRRIGGSRTLLGDPADLMRHFHQKARRQPDSKSAALSHARARAKP